MVAVRRIWIIVACVIVVIVVLPVIAGHLLNADRYRGQIQAALTQSLGRSVTLGPLSFSIFSGSLVADSPSIADDPRFSSRPFLAAKDIRIGVDTGAYLFHHELHISSLTVDQPQINLLRAANGTWNYSSLGGKNSRDPAAENDSLLPNLTVQQLDVQGGTLTLGTLPAHGPAHIYTSLDVTAKDFAMNKVFGFKVSGKLPDGGTLGITGNAGPIDQRDASLTPLTAQISLQQADLLAAGFVQPEQGISGIADLDAKIISNGQMAQMDGKLHLAKLKLANNGSPSSEPVDSQFSIDEDMHALSGKVDNASIQIGHAVVNLSGTFQTQGNATTVALQAAGQNMPVDDLVAFLPSLGVQLPSGARLRGGTMTVELGIAGPVNAPVIEGPVRITGTQLAGFDLGQKVGALQAFTGAKTGSDTTIQVLDGNLHYGPDGTRTNNLALVVSGLGSASGNGTISPGGVLNYHLLVKVNAAGASGVATQALGMLPGAFGSALGQTTRNGVPLSISGTTSNPVFTPDVGSMLGGTTQKTPQANPLGNVLGGLLKR